MMNAFWKSEYNIVFMLTILVIFIAWVIIILFSMDWYYPSAKKELDEKTKKGSGDYIFRRAFSEYNLFRTTAMFWMMLDYMFTILPFEAALFVLLINSQKPDEIQQSDVLKYSIVSLALIVFSFAINPKRHMRCYRKAYVKMSVAINQYIIENQGTTCNFDNSPSGSPIGPQDDTAESSDKPIDEVDSVEGVNEELKRTITENQDKLLINQNASFEKSQKELIKAMEDAENCINPSYDVD